MKIRDKHMKYVSNSVPKLNDDRFRDKFHNFFIFNFYR